MKRYRITLTLTGDTQVVCKVSADNQAKALARLEQTPQFAEIVNGKDVLKVDIEPIVDEPIADGRFILQRSKTKENGFVCTDTVNNIVCEFEKHHYNETQKFTHLEDSNVDAEDMATIMREFGDWLYDNYPYVAMPIDEQVSRQWFGKQLAKLRKAKGLTYYKLAQLAGLQPINVQRIEEGKYGARIDTIIRLLDVLDARIDFGFFAD